MSFVLSGCIFSSLENCPAVGNVKITFYYNGDGQSDIFSDKVESVNLYIFNNTGELICSKYISHEQLRAYQGIALSLPHGEYRIVCWGNTGNKTDVIKDASFDANYISILNVDQTLTSTDRLYYSISDKFTVGDKEVHKTMEFRSAHATVNFITKGMSDPDNGSLDFTPDVKLGKFYSAYDFNMQPMGKLISFNHRATIIDATNNKTITQFITPRLVVDIPIDITIYKEQETNMITSIDLWAFIQNNNIDINKQELEINVQVEYKNGEITLTLHNWDLDHITTD